MSSIFSRESHRRAGFSLIEVVLAIGIFLVTVLALVGLLGPTLQSVDEVEKTDEVSSVVNTVNSFLQSSPDIAPNDSKFDAIYEAVANDGFATLIVYRWYDDDATTGDEPPVVRLEIGFSDAEGGAVDPRAVVNAGDADFSDAAGPIYRVVLSASSVTPEDLRSNRDTTTGIYTLSEPLTTYPEGYLAMEVRIFARSEDMQAVQSGDLPDPGPDLAQFLAQLNNEEPLFTYNTAVVR